MILEGLKIVTAKEMARVEALAYKEGASEIAFMENAAVGIEKAVEDFIQEKHLMKSVTIIAGKGNNAGDAYAAGARLLDRGYQVSAFAIYPLSECSSLCKKMYERFRAKGGKIKHSEPEFDHQGVILDGLIGTGFYGKAEGALEKAIVAANRSSLPVLAIDIPSGLNGDTGEVGSVAINAALTIFLGLPKSGFFLKQGWDHVGKLRHESFGLTEKYIAQAKPIAYLLNEKMIPHLMPPIKRTRHKYEAGYVLAIAGSLGMPGAALLASYSTLRSGAGIVRLFHPEGMEAELSGAPYELIREGWDMKNLKAIREQAKRAKAMLIGPGIGRTKKAEKMFKDVIARIQLPAVIDADALFFLAKASTGKLPKHSVLTPHHGEMQLLLSKKQPDLKMCQEFAEKKKATVVLKGAPNMIFHPGCDPLVIGRGDPGMATAGSGDVLTGMIAAMIAQGLDSRHAAVLAVYLHGIAGEMAAEILTSYCMTASDLIKFLPGAFHSVKPS